MIVGQAMSLAEFLDVYSVGVARQNHAIDVERGGYRVNLIGRSSDWYGDIDSHYQADKLLRHGWYDGVKRLLALKSAVEVPPAVDRRRRIRRGPDGDTLDIDRALAGDWDNAWTAARSASVRTPTTIDVVGMLGGNAGRSSEELFWGGATAVVLVDALEAAGYSVRLLAASVARMDSTKVHAANVVTVKDAGETLRPDIVASVYCHAGIFRSYWFRARINLPTKIDANLGFTSGSEVADELKAEGLISQDAILLDHTYGIDQCRSQIQRVIAQLQDR